MGEPLLLLLLLRRFSRVWLSSTPQTAAHQASPSLGFSRQEHWSGLPFPSPMHASEKWKWSPSVMSYSSRPHGLQPTRLLCPWDFPGKSTGVGCHWLLRVSPSGAVNVKQLIGVINGLLTSHMILFCIPLLFPELSLSLFRVFRILTAWQEFLLIVPAFFSELFRLNT